MRYVLKVLSFVRSRLLLIMTKKNGISEAQDRELRRLNPLESRAKSFFKPQLSPHLGFYDMITVVLLRSREMQIGDRSYCW